MINLIFNWPLHLKHKPIIWHMFYNVNIGTGKSNPFIRNKYLILFAGFNDSTSVFLYESYANPGKLS
jgi:hypothetical protein